MEKKLVVNEPEAERVRAIFALYLELGSLLLVADELRRRGWMPKVWTTKAGKETRPPPFSKSSVHGLLENVIYLGKIHAGDEVVEAEHDAIVEQTAARRHGRFGRPCPIGQEPTNARSRDASTRTVAGHDKVASGDLGRPPCIYRHLRRFARHLVRDAG